MFLKSKALSGELLGVKFLNFESLRLEFLKWWVTFKVLLFNKTIYKLDFFLTAIVPGLAFFFIKYSLWKTAYLTSQLEIIQGYTLTQMLQYQFWVLIVGFLAKGHDSLNLSEEIRKGRISTYLVRPFQFWKHHTCDFLSYQALQCLPTSFCLALSFSLSLFSFIPLYFLKGLVICLLVSVLWFMLQFCIGLVAFWMEETWSLRVLLLILANFCSGGFFPLEIFPEKFVSFLNFTPFPYMTYVPATYFLGSRDSFFSDVFVLLAWIFLATLLYRLIWKKGIKYYEGAGI